MIYDSLQNIDIYKGLSSDIYEGLVFLKQAKPDIECGTYRLNPRVKAIVSEYNTQKVNEHGYEAHKRFIDIQCNLKGTEIVCYLPIEKLIEVKPYDSKMEASFYTTEEKPHKIIIGNGYFAIFFPQDGHKPQLCIDDPMLVKKIVIKVQIPI